VNGELIGINVAVRAGAQGIGFALPIDEVKRVATAMLSTRRLTSSWHGLVSNEQRRGPRRGVVVSEVEQGSPAEASGFKLGDELLRIGDLAIASPLDVERAMLDVHPGHPATVTILRGKNEKAIPLDVKSVSASENSPDDQVWRLLGLKTRAVSTDFVSSVSPKLRGGLFIQAVSPGSPAAQAAIHKGDILVGMNVGTRHWETIRSDNILYVLRQPETTQTQSAVLYLVRRNSIQPCRISLADTTVQSTLSQ
jgi:serine protease Do